MALGRRRRQAKKAAKYEKKASKYEKKASKHEKKASKREKKAPKGIGPRDFSRGAYIYECWICHGYFFFDAMDIMGQPYVEYLDWDPSRWPVGKKTGITPPGTHGSRPSPILYDDNDLVESMKEACGYACECGRDQFGR